MMFGVAHLGPFEIGDKIRFRPDPFNWEIEESLGVVDDIKDGKYTIKWFDGTIDTLSFDLVDGYCELIERPDKKHCFHEWKLYKGFTKVYEFCILCDKKRDV